MPSVGERYARALITGAGSGLGKVFTESLIAEGVSVWGTSRDPVSLVSSERFTPVKLDLTTRENLESWFETLDDESGGFDLVINNAGYAVLSSVELQTAADIAEQIQVLMTGPIRLASVALGRMRHRQRGCLVNVSSVAGEMWVPYLSVYNAAKSGLSVFSQSSMLENPDSPPWIIDFRPGDYRTAFNNHMIDRTPLEHGSGIARRRLDQLMRDAPDPQKAAADLLLSLGKFCHCTQYSGSFLQTRFASLAGRLLPNALKRKVLRRFFHIK